MSVIPIYSCMRHRTIQHFTAASSAAILACCLAYTGAATFGYLTFGSNVHDDILLNYNAREPRSEVTKLSLCKQ